MNSNEDQYGTITDTKTDSEVKKPSMFKVILHNDDITPRDFVVKVLKKFFGKNDDSASMIMYAAHRNGYSLVSVLTLEMAETKTQLALSFARKHLYPLTFSIEEE